MVSRMVRGRSIGLARVITGASRPVATPWVVLATCSALGLCLPFSCLPLSMAIEAAVGRPPATSAVIEESFSSRPVHDDFSHRVEGTNAEGRPPAADMTRPHANRSASQAAAVVTGSTIKVSTNLESTSTEWAATVASPATSAEAQDAAETLETRLAGMSTERLAEKVLAEGEPQRGAVLYYQAYLTCIQCHEPTPQGTRLGPDLSQPHADDPADRRELTANLVRSLLHPSEVIRKEFQTVLIETIEGQTFRGIVSQRDDVQLELVDAQTVGTVQRFALDSIEQEQVLPTSLMPNGLVNSLPSEQAFYDLTAYLVEIRQGGSSRVLALRPPDSLIAPVPIPSYEARLDHAGFMTDWNQASLERGRDLYHRVCANCHGTPAAPGSMPTSLAFATGKFRNGFDPHSMYQTMTRGFGLMPAQTLLVPSQKYDVIHYIREAILKPLNPSQYLEITPDYLASLPRGSDRGPEAKRLTPWIAMDYGTRLLNTYEVGKNQNNLAAKGIALRLDPGPGGVSAGRQWILYEHDTLRMAAAWTGEGFIDWRGIHFDGAHGVHPRLVGDVLADTANEPAWSNPETGDFVDLRILGRDDQPYGPLPRSWQRFLGFYQFGQQSILSYQIGSVGVLEWPAGYTLPSSAADGTEATSPLFVRNLRIAPHSEGLLHRVARVRPGLGLIVEHTITADPSDSSGTSLVTRQYAGTEATPSTTGEAAPEWRQMDGKWCLWIPPSNSTQSIRIGLFPSAWQGAVEDLLRATPQPTGEQWAEATRGGSSQWPQVLTTEVAAMGSDQDAFETEMLSWPTENPWQAQMRLTGLDFFEGGDRAAVCAWDGDIWLVDGLLNPEGQLQWRRIASGLFQPLGIRVIHGEIFVTCRDQLVKLHDLNGDLSVDYYECFNSDHQVTNHFHEFAMGLQTDAAGNFYYAKSARHALKALVPHHGTLLRVSADGATTEILATGFRAANGVCLNPDGTFFVTDQEGHWMPKNRINWVKPGGFYGNMFGYHDVTDESDAAMEPPLCWITNAFDRSPAELLWVPQDRWGPLGGSLLNLSYGYGKVYVVPHEIVEGEMQGGMVALPLPQFPTGIMRGRFHPHNDFLYLSGMFAWAGNQTEPGGLYRIRLKPGRAHVPRGLRTLPHGMELEFAEPVDSNWAAQPERWLVSAWSLRRTANYGSEHHDVQQWEVTDVAVSEDGKTITLTIPQLKPTWCMEIKYDLKTPAGGPLVGTIHNTIHRLPEPVVSE